MLSKNLTELKKDIEEIDDLIKEAIQSDFLPDKLYIEITTKIGAFDEAFVNAKFSSADANFLAWAKKRLDKICNMLIDEQMHCHPAMEDDLMHPTGDYYNEDNSIFISQQLKDSLQSILNEKFRE